MGKGPQESIHRKTVFKHTTVCSTSFMTREMHRKTAMIFPFSAGKLVKIKRLITHYQKREEKGILSPPFNVCFQDTQAQVFTVPFGITSSEIPRKLHNPRVFFFLLGKMQNTTYFERSL